VCDSVKQKEETIVAGAVTWRLRVVVELMEDRSSLEYIKFQRLDEFKVAENIRQCEVYFVCVEYLLYILGYV
jgi:hypothetical protein